MMPKISICVPTYNGSEFLRECLDSILDQTFTDFELIVVDDRSSDLTIEIAEEYAVKDSRIRVVKNPQNLGLVGNWNHCIDIAKGEWVKFVFQDDLIFPDCLEKMLAVTNTNSKFLFCRRNFIFERGTSEELQQFYLSLLLPERFLNDTTQITTKDFCKVALQNLGLNFIGEPTNVMIKKDVFQILGKFNPNLIQLCDLELWLRIGSNNGITYVPETLATFRVHQQSTTANNTTNNNYRKSLDILVILHDLAHHQVYNNFRTIAGEMTPVVNAKKMFDRYSYRAWREVKAEIVVNSEDIGENKLKVWNNLVQTYPKLRTNWINKLEIEYDNIYQKQIQSFKYLLRKTPYFHLIEKIFKQHTI